MNTRASVQRLLDFDPLATCEEEIDALRNDGIFLKGREKDAIFLSTHIQTSQIKSAILTALGDVHFGSELGDYFALLDVHGFERVLALPFTGRAYGDEPVPNETYYIYAHRDGMIASFDTYNGDGMNGGKLYYNWTPNCNRPNWGYDGFRLSSGGWDEIDGQWIWAGDHDIREALDHKLEGLKSVGKTLNPWKRSPFIWLLHYMDNDSLRELDTKVGPDDERPHQRITRERLEMLPTWVQDMVNIK